MVRTLLAACILLAVVAITQWRCNRLLNTEIELRKTVMVDLASRLEGCAETARRQNVAVDSLIAAGERQRERVDGAAEKAVTIGRHAREAADRALIEPVSAVCDSASTWGRLKAEDLNRVWRKR